MASRVYKTRDCWCPQTILFWYICGHVLIKLEVIVGQHMLGICGSSIHMTLLHGPLTRYVKLWVAHASGMPGTFSRHRCQWKPLVNNPDVHHGTCVTHVPGCMLGSLTHGGRENVPGIPGACTTRISTNLVRGPWRIVQDKYATVSDNCLPCNMFKMKYHRYFSYRQLFLSTLWFYCDQDRAQEHTFKLTGNRWYSKLHSSTRQNESLELIS